MVISGFEQYAAVAIMSSLLAGGSKDSPEVLAKRSVDLSECLSKELSRRMKENVTPAEFVMDRMKNQFKEK